MATGKITKRAVDAMPLPSPGKRAYLWDVDLKGFGLMVTDKGARSYLVQYRIGGRGNPTRRFTIGRHGSPWTPDTARSRAREVLELVHRKIDPVDDERERLAAAKAKALDAEASQKKKSALAFNRVAADYAAWCEKNLKRGREQSSIIARDLTPVFGSTPLTDITPEDIEDALSAVADRSATAALKAYVALSALYTFAQEKHRKLLPASASPIPQVKRPEGVGRRDRFLERWEQRLFWEASGVMGWPFGPIYRLLLLTGMRLREVAEAEWREINLEESSWLIPARRSKNGLPHWVHLSPAAIKIIKALPRIANPDGEDFLFSTTGTSPVSGFSRGKARLTKLMGELEEKDATDKRRDMRAVDQFVIHDTRRTFAREMQKLQTPPEIVERLLGHVTHTKSGLKGTYQVYEYEQERKAAMDSWADLLATIVLRNNQVIAVRGAA